MRLAAIKLKVVPGTEQPGEFAKEYQVVDGGLVAVNPRYPPALSPICFARLPLLLLSFSADCTLPKTPLGGLHA